MDAASTHLVSRIDFICDVCMCVSTRKAITGELHLKLFIFSFLLYFNELLIVLVVSWFLKLHNLWLWSYSTAKCVKFK